MIHVCRRSRISFYNINFCAITCQITIINIC
nr:MAG TPA: hypothetical protein [Caudoviricetes sp.]DAV51781.1 MAG TPA: hypothetical protein [Caudoviricetes sp.]